MQWALACSAGDSDSPPADGWLAIDGPMTVAAALRAAGRWSLDAPRRNFDDEAWWFRARFDAKPGDAILGFDGIATCAQAWLNGEQVLSGTNMFVAHRCDVEKLLRPAGNELLIRCESLNAQLKTRRPRPRWRTPMLTQQQLRWWRTTLLGRTPGWSPPAAPVGPWREVWLAPRDAVSARDVRLHSRLEGRNGYVHCALDKPMRAELRLAREGREWRLPIDGEGTLCIEDAQPWWPHTHGEPTLYEASLLFNGGVLPLPPVGFRTVEMETANGDFHVRVNGERVFCRGAVWMPLDPVSLRASPADYDKALAQAAAAGMNMLRVAGITVYEEDAFYEACDRAGVLVWQEFMFANMDYPSSDHAFMRSVEEEATQQLARLASHPSLAILCGNSEAEQQAAMWGAPRESWQQALFHDTLPRLCRELAPGVPYWPSSTHGGALPQQADAGTTSYYGVGAYLRPLEDARRANLKFATECLAFANMPEPATLARMPGGESLRPHHPAWKERAPRDLGAGWDFEDVRDHYLELFFGASARELRSADVERYLALSRIASAEAMAAAFSEWRRAGSSCGGALVLMLRDLWAGAGWGLLDDQGVPKACWHALRGVLQPVALLITDEGLNGLCLHAINESAEARELTLTLKAWQGGDVQVAQGGRPIALAPRSAVAIPAAELLDHFIDLNWSHRFGPPPCDVVACNLLDSQGRAVARAHHFPHGHALAVERDIGLHARIAGHDSFGCTVAVTTRRFAYGVHFDFPGMTADDNHFHLAPGDERHIALRGTLAPQGRGWVRAINAAQATRIEGAAG
ncbi:glycoside hydrolase family 2 protein [Ramlibacter sp. PS4R-6]|uniref:glycoside hydrolase family 2 protein n=1 Tax=Ramlibacter sp. PS4R-6 TaxID=3133438 RepID=UPI00309CB982